MWIDNFRFDLDGDFHGLLANTQYRMTICLKQDGFSLASGVRCYLVSPFGLVRGGRIASLHKKFLQEHSAAANMELSEYEKIRGLVSSNHKMEITVY